MTTPAPTAASFGGAGESRSERRRRRSGQHAASNALGSGSRLDSASCSEDSYDDDEDLVLDDEGGKDVGDGGECGRGGNGAGGGGDDGGGEGEGEVESGDGDSGARAKRKGNRVDRRIVEDGILKPDTSTMSAEDKEKAMKTYGRLKNNAAVQRLRSKRKALQRDMEDEDEGEFLIRSLQDVAATENGGWRAHLLEGCEHDSKGALLFSLRESAEFVVITLRYPDNDLAVVHAVPESKCGVSLASFDVTARFYQSKKAWIVTKSSLTGERGSAPGKGQQKTAYNSFDLAVFARSLLGGNPGASAKTLANIFEPVLRHPRSLSSNQFSRIRRMVCVDIFGVPNENVQFMPQLKLDLEECGHAFEYTTCSGKRMRSVIIALARDEHERLRKVAQNKSAGARTADERAACVGWLEKVNGNPSPKEEWISKKSDLLENVAESNARYVNGASLALKHGLVAGEKLLHLFQVDACTGKVYLDCYTLFAIVGFTSNFNIVTLAYVWKCANESTESWTDVFNFVHSKFPWLQDTATIASDRDKGITAAILEVFGADMMQFFCVIHRKKNFGGFGKSVLAVYDSLVYAKTPEEIATIKSSTAYSNMPEAAKLKFESVPDRVQYLAACAVAGGSTYGHSSSQAIESQNFHVDDARCLDLPNSVVWVTAFEENRFKKWAAASAACVEWMPPKVKASFNELSTYGRVTQLTSGDPEILKFMVKTFGNRRRFVDLHVVRDSSGSVISYFGKCSCGVPARDYFPCAHFNTVAVARNFEENRLIPVALNAASWKAQYPVGMSFASPSLDAIRAREGEDVAKDVNLRLPVVAPPKRGRPRVKRARHAMEFSVRRTIRRNNVR